MVEAPKVAVPDGTVPVLQLEPKPYLPEPGEASQVASCACDDAAGSVHAKASADDVSSVTRRRQVTAKQSFPALNTSPNKRVSSGTTLLIGLGAAS